MCIVKCELYYLKCSAVCFRCVSVPGCSLVLADKYKAEVEMKNTMFIY